MLRKTPPALRSVSTSFRSPAGLAPNARQWRAAVIDASANDVSPIVPTQQTSSSSTRTARYRASALWLGSSVDAPSMPLAGAVIRHICFRPSRRLADDMVDDSAPLSIGRPEDVSQSVASSQSHGGRATSNAPHALPSTHATPLAQSFTSLWRGPPVDAAWSGQDPVVQL
ncbi:hypothetical protein ATCC90586_007546 [Pythium insidiosum]|nr:hypothetical protein ATCC90586_007546 [Pythium insidiosum]